MKVRPIVDADFEPLAALVAEDETVLFGSPSRLGPADVRGWLDRADLERDSWLYETDGAPLAFSWFELHADLGVFVGIVAQGAKDRGLGTRIVENGAQHARERGAARVHSFAVEPDSAAAALFERHGFSLVRRFWEMAIELDAEPSVPELPAPLTLERFRVEDARPFYETMSAAFRDHWEHHDLGFDGWWEQKQAAHDFDPTLWFLIRDGNDVAAVIRNDPERNGGGYVGALGVARPWRGKGLGRALLLRTFAEFYARGAPRVTLGVDAENPTGATKLYEGVGMTIEKAMVVFEKALA